MPAAKAAKAAKAARVEMPARVAVEVGSKVKVVSSDKAEQPEERKAVAAIKSLPVMTGPIHFPM